MKNILILAAVATLAACGAKQEPDQNELADTNVTAIEANEQQEVQMPAEENVQPK